MDLDQRTRLIGGRGGRVILLGDGTEIVTSAGPHDDDDDDDIDMEDRGEAEEVNDHEGTTKSTDATASRGQREETPGPEKSSEPTAEDGKPEKPKIMAASDSIDSKTVGEHTTQQK